MRLRYFLACAFVLWSSAAFAEDPSCKTAPGITPPVVSDIPDLTKFFPAISQVLGEEGDVQLSFTVGANGRVGDVKVDKSSGSARLDAAALQVAALWRYKAATLNGDRVACTNKAIVKWKLSGEGTPSPSRIIIPALDSWPEGARQDAIEGVTIVRAEVAPDGKIKTKILSGSGSRDLDKEAVARVLARPDVKPDMWNDKPVGALFTFYVIWSLTPVTLPERKAQGPLVPSAD